MKLKRLQLVLLLCFALPAEAQNALQVSPINPLLLECKLRNDRFWSEIRFSVSPINGKLSGVLGNYVFTAGNSKRFISGNELFDILAFDSAIIGHTGDPRGVVSRFSLVQQKTNSALWVYEQVDPQGEKTVANFHCYLNALQRP